MLLTELSRDAKIKDACRKIGYPNHEDLYQELFVVLCETPTEKLQEMKDAGYIHFWIVRTLMNMTSPTGIFYRKYKTISDDTEASKQLTEPQEEDREQVLELETKRAEVESLLQKYEKAGRKDGGWYKVNLLKMYSEVGNYRKMGELTGISFPTINKDVNDFIKELRATAGIARS